MRQVKPITIEQVEYLYRADQALRNAIRWVKQAEAPQTLKRLRQARSSMGGAIRHAERRFLATRQEKTMPGPHAFSAGWLRHNPEAIAPAAARKPAARAEGRPGRRRVA